MTATRVSRHRCFAVKVKTNILVNGEKVNVKTAFSGAKYIPIKKGKGKIEIK